MKIGLEMHFQLPTKSKLFCSCPTSSAAPNHNVCPICLGYPGSRPSLNRKALEIGLMHRQVPELQDRREGLVLPEDLLLPGPAEELPDHPVRIAAGQRTGISS